MTTWIFQANPEVYDLPAALHESAVFTWLVNQYRSEIKPDDKVYLWETGKQAGVLAVGTVLSEPALIAAEPGEDKFNRDDQKLSGEKLRARIRVDQVLPTRLLKTNLVRNPALADLPNVKFANATNFKLSDEHAAALAAEVDRANGRLPADEEAVELPTLTDEDFDVLARYRAAKPWDELPAEDRVLFTALRSKLVDYATALANRLDLHTELVPFASHPNPSGRNALYYWSCVFPKKAKTSRTRSSYS